mgnify:CR=1 FL=1
MSEIKIKHTARTMSFIAWILGLTLLTYFIGGWEENQVNPNKHPETSRTNNKNQVMLQQNRIGHYLVDGKINHAPATFLLDTGATDVVIPAQLASEYKLIESGYKQTITANGMVTVAQTNIEVISIGDINLYNVRASINPGMQKDQEVLLGMSALKQLELTQVNQTLTLTQYD